MELGNIVELLDNKTILVTGATGFIAKLFVEKILRVQPKVKKIYLLLRAGDEKSAMERMHKEVIGKILFDVLRKKYGEEGFISLVSKKVCPVPGDVSKENLGVDIGSSLRDEMLGEIEFVINFAATTDFNERYDVSLGTNTFGALHVLNFAKSCAKLKKLIHVSTGRILEKPFQLGEARKGNKRIDIDLEQKMVQEKLRELLSKYGDDQSPITSFLKDLGTQRAKHYGWPNTYVFTKSMGEMLLMHLKDDVPLLILRPTMVTSTYKEPFPGWIEGVRTFDGVVMAYGLGKLKCFLFNPESICDAIPGDMVVNGIIVAMMMVHDNKKLSSEIVYHLGSSYRNPLMFQDLQAFTIRYFSGNPLIGKDGNPIIPPKFTPLTTITSFRIYKMLLISLPIKAFEMVNIILRGKYQDTYDVLTRRVKLMTKFADCYAPFGLFKGIFDDTNSEELRRKARLNGSDALAFDFDPMSINWEDYLMNIHIPGLIKYAMK